MSPPCGTNGCSAITTATADMALPVSVMRNRYTMADVAQLQEAVERDVMDGHIDDQDLSGQYAEKIRALIASLSDTLARIGK